ncbi:beta-glucosidase, partial [Aggregatibacter actinomycetemcomitans]
MVSIYEGLARALEGKATLLYAKGANFTTDTRLSERLKHYNTPLDLDPRSAEALLDEALDVARRAKVIVAVVGEPWSVNDESISRAHINLPASQRRLLGALKSLDKPLVIVLVNGR